MFPEAQPSDIILFPRAQEISVINLKCFFLNIFDFTRGFWRRCYVKKVLECFAGITKLNKHRDNALFKLIHRHDVFVVLPTGFGKSLILQLLPSLCLNLNSMGYNSFPEKCVIVICPLVVLIESHMNELKKRGISCASLSGMNQQDKMGVLGR